MLSLGFFFEKWSFTAYHCHGNIFHDVIPTGSLKSQIFINDVRAWINTKDGVPSGASLKTRHQLIISVSSKPSNESVTGDKRITGGHESVPGAWPWMAGIFVTGIKNYFKCGATLIDAQWVVTAAHCTFINLGPILVSGTKMPEILEVVYPANDISI